MKKILIIQIGQFLANYDNMKGKFVLIYEDSPMDANLYYYHLHSKGYVPIQLGSHQDATELEKFLKSKELGVNELFVGMITDGNIETSGSADQMPDVEVFFLMMIRSLGGDKIPVVCASGWDQHNKELQRLAKVGKPDATILIVPDGDKTQAAEMLIKAIEEKI